MNLVDEKMRYQHVDRRKYSNRICVYERYEQVTCLIMKAETPVERDEYSASNLL